MRPVERDSTALDSPSAASEESESFKDCDPAADEGGGAGGGSGASGGPIGIDKPFIPITVVSGTASVSPALVCSSDAGFGGFPSVGA